MNLFENMEASKDTSELEVVGNQPTQPMSLVYSVNERKEWSKLLKKAMQLEYPTNYKEKNYSDFFLLLLKRHYEDTNN